MIINSYLNLSPLDLHISLALDTLSMPPTSSPYLNPWVLDAFVLHNATSDVYLDIIINTYIQLLIFVRVRSCMNTFSRSDMQVVWFSGVELGLDGYLEDVFSWGVWEVEVV